MTSLKTKNIMSSAILTNINVQVILYALVLQSNDCAMWF